MALTMRSGMHFRSSRLAEEIAMLSGFYADQRPCRAVVQ
jgi:hypothetical protein